MAQSGNQGFQVTGDQLNRVAGVFDEESRRLFKLNETVAQSVIGPESCGKPFTQIGQNYRTAIDQLEDDFQAAADQAAEMAQLVRLSAATYGSMDSGLSGGISQNLSGQQRGEA